MNPLARDVDSAMKLALCNLILESATQVHYVADYLLFWLNRSKVLLDICQSNDIRFPTYIAQRRAERWDIDRAAKMFIEMFRNNKLRDHCLDIDLFQNYITKII
ncbi:unnamed protein product [Gongylonema pulchrum]|uniref:Uncharacterized protein n=1 Tax=Gongylonema pulchrum TaxID=637853 RepID=A0A3P7MXC1_9BILA|nr:unnamed protein product [Gongylonema pulchrum]